jgi:hypothetical protein
MCPHTAISFLILLHVCARIRCHYIAALSARVSSTAMCVSSYYCICVLILLYTCPCPHTAVYVSSCYYVSSYYNMCPHTTIYVSSYYCICASRLPCMCPHTTLFVLIRLAAIANFQPLSQLPYMCPRTTIFILILLHVCPHSIICVLILLHMCPHTTVYVSSYYYICGSYRPTLSRCLRQLVTISTGFTTLYYYICVLMLLYMCLLVFYHRSSASFFFFLFKKKNPRTTISKYVSAYYYELCMCPRTTKSRPKVRNRRASLPLSAMYVSSHYHICVLIRQRSALRCLFNGLSTRRFVSFGACAASAELLGSQQRRHVFAELINQNL